MTLEITTITMKLMAGLATVNCYLLNSDKNYLLIDTGSAAKKKDMDLSLQDAGCQPREPEVDPPHPW